MGGGKEDKQLSNILKFFMNLFKIWTGLDNIEITCICFFDEILLVDIKIFLT